MTLTSSQHRGPQAAPARPAMTRWLSQRQALLVQLIATVKKVDDSESAYQAELKSLRDLLLDYVSAGHFEIYAMLLPESARNRELQEAYRRIEQTTQAALRFDEFADQLRSEPERREALSHLGMALEERFELEDQLAGRAMRFTAAAG